MDGIYNRLNFTCLMKYFFLFFLFFNPLKGSSQIRESSPFEFYRFYLKEPAQELLEIKYDHTCEPAEGRLLPGGKSILIKNYRLHQRMYVRLKNFDGSETEFVQSPCFIDPVAGEL
jgi:hypothetical protein